MHDSFPAAPRFNPVHMEPKPAWTSSPLAGLAGLAGPAGPYLDTASDPATCRRGPERITSPPSQFPAVERMDAAYCGQGT
jgi:hypothetical protein